MRIGSSRSGRVPLWCLAACLAGALAACTDAGEQQRRARGAGSEAARARALDDPAMQIDARPAAAAQGVEEPDPSGSRVDVANRRVFVPGEGWLEEPAFWRLYHDQPQRLPADLDLEAVQRLRATREAQPET